MAVSYGSTMKGDRVALETSPLLGILGENTKALSLHGAHSLSLLLSS